MARKTRRVRRVRRGKTMRGGNFLTRFTQSNEQRRHESDLKCLIRTNQLFTDEEKSNLATQVKNSGCFDYFSSKEYCNRIVNNFIDKRVSKLDFKSEDKAFMIKTILRYSKNLLWGYVHSGAGPSQNETRNSLHGSCHVY